MDEDSPAGRAGVRAGDVIQTLDDTVLAMGDSILGEYCKILYTHESHEVLPIQVYRPSNGTALGRVERHTAEGRISGTGDYPRAAAPVEIKAFSLSRTAPMGTRSCSRVSRSRMVTFLSSMVSKSTVTQKGVPASSWRR